MRHMSSADQQNPPPPSTDADKSAHAPVTASRSSSGIPSADFLQKLSTAAELLEQLEADPTLLAPVPEEIRQRLLKVAGKLFSPDIADRRRFRKAKLRHQKSEKQEKVDTVLESTGIRQLRRKPVFTTPNYSLPLELPPAAITEAPAPRQLSEAQNCYICKRDYRELHHFYDQLCPQCAELNFRKRSELADLSGRLGLLTGGRVKIGYQAGIKLLRCGARLIVATRFPRDAAARYAAEPDFAVWGDRLEVFGIDLRHTPSVEAFCTHLLNTHTRLDFIINNACQTVRRPPDYYQHMMTTESGPLDALPEKVRRILGNYEGLRRYHMLPEGSVTAPLDGKIPGVSGLVQSADLSQLRMLPEEFANQDHLFPEGRLDKDLQQVDLRDRNSWRFTLAEVPTVELLEVQLVNAVAPFILNARLKPLMLRTPERDKHIVNVSAVEGQFYRKFKTTRHPHTNMAKAALNMMTRTSAADYQVDGIHMNSVDTGWVTDEDPAEIAERKVRDHRFHPPLDIVDGAARDRKSVV